MSKASLKKATITKMMKLQSMGYEIKTFKCFFCKKENKLFIAGTASPIICYECTKENLVMIHIDGHVTSSKPL